MYRPEPTARLCSLCGAGEARLAIPCDRRSSMKGQQKPKQLAKKAPQKTLKERRAEKQANAKDKRSTSGI